MKYIVFTMKYFSVYLHGAVLLLSLHSNKIVEAMAKKYRIKDIAELAGVSTGTVDRVIHNRGEVSADSRKKLKKC